MPHATFFLVCLKSEFARCGLGRASSPKSSTEAEMLGLKSPSDWSVLSLRRISGLLLLPDLFHAGGQHHWVRRCLVDYPCKPNICNLDAHMEREGSGCLWPPNTEDVDTPLHASSEAKKLKLQPSTVSKESLVRKLRWVTLGYHYDWNTKEYSSDHKSPFPTDLAALSRFILHHAGFPGCVISWLKHCPKAHNIMWEGQFRLGSAWHVTTSRWSQLLIRGCENNNLLFQIWGRGSHCELLSPWLDSLWPYRPLWERSH